MIKRDDIVAKLDSFFNVAAFDESSNLKNFPPGYESIFETYAAPGFLKGPWNGLMLDNAAELERVYTIVFPAQSVLDTIIAYEVERGAPGALIFSHHMRDYQESGPGHSYITEAQLHELKEHNISYYTCHLPLDCQPEVSTCGALAAALKLSDTSRFAPYKSGLGGVYGKVVAANFHEFAWKCAEATRLPRLRYDQVRNNGRPVQRVAIVTGMGADPKNLQEAASLGCDTFVTGEWWLFGPGEFRTTFRDEMRTVLNEMNLNLIGTSHYASEAVVMRDEMPNWFYENTPGVEPMFIGQDDPWR